jgi:uncharacterized protein YkwD
MQAFSNVTHKIRGRLQSSRTPQHRSLLRHRILPLAAALAAVLPAAQAARASAPAVSTSSVFAGYAVTSVHSVAASGTFASLGAPAESLYFPATGKTVAGDFLRTYQRYGLESIGYPISAEVMERGFKVQYFERARMEYHPEYAAAGNTVLLTRLGVEISAGSNFARVSPAGSTKNRIYFKETGHALSEPFLSYWQSRGGLKLFGYPISEQITQDGLRVQWFERVRMEYHPELAAKRQAVQLTRLGSLLFDRVGGAMMQVSAPAAPAAPAAPPAAPAQPQLNGAENAIFAEINNRRAAVGLAPVQLSSDLASLARSRSDDMAARNYFSHTTPEGRGFLDMLKARGISYKFAGEILAKNNYPDSQTASGAMDSWMNSPSHKSIMLDPRFNYAGPGVTWAGDGYFYFAVVFVQR